MEWNNLNTLWLAKTENKLTVDFFWINMSLTSKEIELAKDFFIQNREMIKRSFHDIKGVEEVLKTTWYSDFSYYKTAEESSYNNAITCYKAIIVMKKNWAESIEALDKLFWNTNTNDTITNNEEINKLKTESKKQQKKDLSEAKLLSEKIKSGK